MLHEEPAEFIRREAAIDAVGGFILELIEEVPTRKDEDGEEYYADMERVFLLLKINKGIAKRINAIPGEETIHEW